MSFWRHPDFAKRLVVGALLSAIAFPLIVWPIYGGPLLWPGLVGNFTASLFAFLCALAWDRREKQRERADEEADYARRAEEAWERELAERRSEARRRFSLLQELRVDAKSFQDASGSLHNRIVLPQLLDGSWAASVSALGAIASDYELVANLSTFYGRVRELQWRLRHRLEITNAEEKRVFDNMTEPLIAELVEEVAGLIPRVEAEATTPSVIEVPFIPSRTVVYAPPAIAHAEASGRRAS